MKAKKRKREKPSFDEFKGRAKEAAGVVTGDEELEREGKLDQMAGKLKRKTSDLIDTGRHALDDDRAEDKR
jgi:uncharacterized protein YjbJ (UPF0337 family)